MHYPGFPEGSQWRYCRAVLGSKLDVQSAKSDKHGKNVTTMVKAPAPRRLYAPTWSFKEAASEQPAPQLSNLANVLRGPGNV